MEIRGCTTSFWWAIEKGERGWDFLFATPHIEIQKLPLSNSNDWHITVNLFFFGITVGWETMKKER